jgi:tetratricopeptide (TPR) repeat protein
MMLSMHRLVQAILRDTLSKGQQRKWGERAICVVTSLFPSGEPETWPQCELYLLHAQTCSEWIDGYTITIPETASLMNRAATYLNGRGLSREAVPFAQRALTVNEQVLGPNHPTTATSLNNLAALYDNQGEYAKAEPLYQRALAIDEQVLGPNHPHTAGSLNNLAALYTRQGEYAKAQPLYQRALAICEQVLGPTHPKTLVVRNNYARSRQ